MPSTFLPPYDHLDSIYWRMLDLQSLTFPLSICRIFRNRPTKTEDFSAVLFCKQTYTYSITRNHWFILIEFVEGPPTAYMFHRPSFLGLINMTSWHLTRHAYADLLPMKLWPDEVANPATHGWPGLAKLGPRNLSKETSLKFVACFCSIPRQIR